VAVVKNLTNGKSYGYLLDGGARKGFQIDMSGVLAAPAATGAGRNLVTDPTTNGLVKTISW
jgi:hypothetical protein